ncbi:MAG: polyribonucleotide nucleotidyltransferase [Chloroflexi bacterium]|nr:polyribonucleotide nucleotidyltransferase [Chloroflexota bacterium]
MQNSFEHVYDSGTLIMETGQLALQANGSILVKQGDCALLVTATMSKPRAGIDFFPLTIDVEERLYSRGKIPGSFFRREGRPSTHGILMARLTDRQLRPLFPSDFRNEVQIVATPLSIDMETPFETLVMTAASAALSISDIPFAGPIAATRIGYIDGDLVVNPSYEQLEESELDLVVSSSRDGVTMMEAGANELPEEVVFDAIKLAHEVNLGFIDFQDGMVEAIGKPKSMDYESFAYPSELDDEVAGILGSGVMDAFSSSTGKVDLYEKLDELRAAIAAELGEEYESNDLRDAFDVQLEEAFKQNVLSGGMRPDGRDRREIRPISSAVGLLPRVHGSGLFNRGETQILGVATLGSVGDAQRLDTLTPEETKRFMLHYNFPPYSVGEVRRIGSPGRREVGHGALAERALAPVLPSQEDFPYTLRIVCEALGSNGSTSMASVCAGTLALMDAGVPIKAPVAGISIGLIDGDNGDYATITDIQGMEDHIGDMDFKVAGTREGITAIQLDIKVNSISFDVVNDALEQAKEARLFILDQMRDTISDTREDLSPFAPRMLQMSVSVDKIGTVIGPGGKTIRGITEETGATVDIEEDGTIVIGAADGAAAQKAVQMIDDLTRDVKVGDIFTGTVARIMDFGAFVNILPGKDGLVHISELSDERVPSVAETVEIGQELTVAVIQIDNLGRVNLSRRALLTDEEIDPNGRDPVGGGRPARTGGYRRDGGRGRNDRGGRDRGGRDRGGRDRGGRDRGGRDRDRGGYRR